MNQKLESLVLDFLRKQEAQLTSTLEGAFDNCIPMSIRFAEFLESEGVKAELVLLVGAPSVERAHVFWQEMPKITHCHYAVRVEGGEVFDWTAKQFDADANHPTVYPSIDETGWEKASIVRRNEGQEFYQVMGFTRPPSLRQETQRIRKRRVV